MSSSKPLDLTLNFLQGKEVVRNNEYRFVCSDFGIIKDFVHLHSSLFKTGQPYRIKEGRIILPLQGHACISVNLIEYDASPHSLIVIPPGSIIQLVSITDNYNFQMIAADSKYIQISKKEDFFEYYLNSRQEIVIPLNEEEWNQAIKYFSIMWDTVQEVPYRREVIQNLLTALLYNVAYIRKTKLNTAIHQLSRQDELYHRFIDLVNKHSKNERTVGFYADKLCLTPRYLNTLIRKVSQQTVMDWINQSITLEAQVLLKHSNLLVYQIADELHFTNPSFFCKFFKRMTGMTPQEYQKM